MGAVYEAFDQDLGVAVALKTVRPEIAADPETARALERRFKQELLLARKVTHRNIVRVHDMGEVDGIKYITMPYLEGDDLATVLKTDLPVESVAPLVRRAIHDVDPEIPVPLVQSFSQAIDRAVAPDRFQLMLVGGFAIAAMLLAALGVYGVPAFAVARRSQELGIRLALGAAPRSLVRLVIVQSLTPVLTGILVGFAGAVAVNRKRFAGGHALIDALNRVGGRHAVGQVTLVENRLVGMKSRGVYETPGGTILYEAHKALEQICLERDLYHYKQQLALKYGELVYYGQWFHPLREAMQAFVDRASEVVTGRARVKLYKGRATAVSATSPLSLYDTKLASFAMSGYDVTAARGFIDLFGLPMKVRGLKQGRKGRKGL
jgi:hypothetical protein